MSDTGVKRFAKGAAWLLVSLLIITLTLGALAFAVGDNSSMDAGVTPADGAEAPKSAFQFTWPATAGATQYGIELLSAPPENLNGTTASAYRIAAALTAGSAPSFSGDGSGLPPGTYWWRTIPVANGILAGSFSAAHWFTIPPPELMLSSPADGESKPVIGPVQFSWQPLPGAVAYGIELLSAPPEAEYNQEASIYRIGSAMTAGTTYTGDTTGLSPGVYYWRVIGANGAGLYGRFSHSRAFVIPPRPSLIAPSGGFNQSATGPLAFDWDDVSGATSYGLELLSAPPENPNGTTPSAYRVGAVAVEVSAYPGNTSGLPAGWYYWRVIAGDANGNPVGTFSNVGSFFYIAPGPKSIDVNLSTQTLTVCLGGYAYRSFLISTGRSGYDTLTGYYTIGEKNVFMAMGGPDYYIPDVPYAMHVVRGIYIHGCYWHNNFGNPMSHGCINLSVPNAAWLFDWTPSGTPVTIHY